MQCSKRRPYFVDNNNKSYGCLLLPAKRENSITSLTEMATNSNTVKHFSKTIQLLRKILKSVWLNHIFSELYGSSIYNQQHKTTQLCYVLDGVSVQSHLIYDYACKFKVTIIVVCLAVFS